MQQKLSTSFEKEREPQKWQPQDSPVTSSLKYAPLGGSSALIWKLGRSIHDVAYENTCKHFYCGKTADGNNRTKFRKLDHIKWRLESI